jgi:hypothetical protein
MKRTDQARVLAKFLVPLLPNLCEASTPLVVLAADHEAVVDPTEPDVHLAVRLELQRIVSAEPDLLTLAADASEPARGRAAERLSQLLLDRDDPAVEVLWALLAGSGTQPQLDVLSDAATSAADSASSSNPKWPSSVRHVRKFLRAGWLRQEVAAVWMNVLIAAVLFFARWLAWPPSGGASPAGTLALGVFAVWVLAFLPGWLYIRFLGQRAGALWDEYVLSLHRLAWDSPGYLPRPPVNSQFYAEWFNDGGVLFAHRQNIYRQKFDSYYGKSVSAAGHRQGGPVKIETLFPVFLITATFAVCWTAVLWDPSFLSAPTTAWDVLKFAFLGAYSFSAQMLIRRFFQNDLRPSAYANVMLRVIVVLILVAALSQLMPADNLRNQAVVAFIIGFFPLVGMQALQRTAAAMLRAAVPSLSPPYPLNQIDGLSVWYEARLLEEGIEDMQSLATANLVDVILHTRVPVGRLVDWVDQAHLYLHFDRIERGWLERTLGTRKEEKGETQSIARGSVTKTSRAGTRTRTAFRQLGIGKATDLLKAFPPKQMDPDVAPEPGSPWAAHLAALKKAGLDIGQVRTMVRVLSSEPSPLAPVWNWYQRGVQLQLDQARSAAPSQLRPAPSIDASRDAAESA